MPTAKQVQKAVQTAQEGLQEVLGLVPLLETKDALEASLRELEGRVSVAEGRVKELASLASVSEQTRAKATEGLDKQVANLEAQIKDLAAQKTTLEARNDAVRQEIARATTEANLQQSKELDEHRERIAVLLREKGEAEAALAQAKGALRTFHQGLASQSA